MGMEILIPQPEMEPVTPAGGVQSLNYWTNREVPKNKFKGMYLMLLIMIINLG